MKIYQLIACGSLASFENNYKIYSKKVYKSQKQARAAMPEFAKLVTTPKNKHSLTVLSTKNLRVLINPLELVENKKEEKNGNTKKR